MQEAFVGLYRHWDRLPGGRRAALRAGISAEWLPLGAPPHGTVRRRRLTEHPLRAPVSVEAAVLGVEERDNVIRAP